MDRRGEDVIRLRRVQHAMVRGVRARDDRLGAQHFARPPLAGLGAYDTDQIVLERQLVHDRQAVAVLHHLERRGYSRPFSWIGRLLVSRKPLARRPSISTPCPLATALTTSVRHAPPYVQHPASSFTSMATPRSSTTRASSTSATRIVPDAAAEGTRPATRPSVVARAARTILTVGPGSTGSV